MNFLIFNLLLFAFSSSFASSFPSSLDGERGFFPPGAVVESRVADSISRDGNGFVTILNPRLKTQYGALALKADSEKICQAFGYFGSLSDQTEHKVTNEKDMLRLFTTVKPKDQGAIDPNLDIAVSFNVEKTDGDLSFRHFHYASKVVCGNLRDVLNLGF